MEKAKLINLIIGILIFAVIVVIDIFLEEEFKRWTIPVTRALLDWPKFFYYYFKAFATVFYYIIVVYTYPSLVLLRNKADAFQIYLFIGLENIIGNTLKFVYHDSRLCMDDHDIKDFADDISCICTWGKPSGHTSSATAFYLIIFHYFIVKNKNIRKGFKIVWGVVIVYIILNIAVSRFYFGDHYINQVLIGLAWGYLVFCLYVVVESKDYIRIIFQKVDSTSNRKRVVIWSILFFILIVNIIALILRQVVVSTFEDNPYHPYETGLSEKCYDKGHFMSDITLTSICFYNFGSYLLIGFLNHPKQIFVDNPKFYKESFKSLWFFVKRMLIFIVVYLPFAFGFFIRINPGYQNYLLTHFYVYSVVLSLNLIMPYLLAKFKCEVRGDYFFTEEYFIRSEKRVTNK